MLELIKQKRLLLIVQQNRLTIPTIGAFVAFQKSDRAPLRPQVSPSRHNSIACKNLPGVRHQINQPCVLICPIQVADL